MCGNLERMQFATGRQRTGDTTTQGLEQITVSNSMQYTTCQGACPRKGLEGIAGDRQQQGHGGQRQQSELAPL